MRCTWHTCTNELTGRQTKFCSDRCANRSAVDGFRRRTKEWAVEIKGGKCERCGYVGHQAAFDFHHKDPATKEFGFGSGNTYAKGRWLVELEKCHLLCRNCHSTVHTTNDPEWVIIPR